MAAGEDLAGAGAELAGEHDQRAAPQHAPLGVVVVLHAFVGIFDLDDRSAVDEQSGHVDRFGQRAAAIAAQVEHDGVDFFVIEFFEQSRDVAGGAFVVSGRVIAKAFHVHVEAGQIDDADLERRSRPACDRLR